jgi:hypothetical protein
MCESAFNASCQWLADGCPDLVNAFSLCEKVKHSYALLEMSYFLLLGKTWVILPPETNFAGHHNRAL